MTSEPEFSIDSIIRRTYRLLRTRPEMFRLDRLKRGYAGLYWPDEQQIELSYRHDILSTLFHEVLHHLYPSWPEKRILSAESFIMRHISQRRAINILKRFAAIL